MSLITFMVPGEPVPFARAGSNGKRRFTPKRQSDFMGAVRLYAGQAMGSRPALDGPVCLRITAFYTIPASWPKKRREGAIWKSSKPDADNISKLVKDSLNTVVWLDDAQVARLHVEKLYAAQASLVVCVEQL